MSMVAKLGGSSLADGEMVKKAADIVLNNPDFSYIVVSAPGIGGGYGEKVTDSLISAYNGGELKEKMLIEIKNRFVCMADKLGVLSDLSKTLDDIFAMQGEEDYDYFISRGEYAMALVFSRYINYPMIDAGELFFFCQNGETDQQKTVNALRKMQNQNKKGVIPGFYGRDSNGKYRVFSRGGSDISGAVIAAALDLDGYWNWTDVDGVMMADPKIVPDAKTVESISYENLITLSRNGARVIHPDSLVPLMKKGITTYIKNTFNPTAKGSEVSVFCHGERDIVGVGGTCGYSLLTLCGNGEEGDKILTHTMGGNCGYAFSTSNRVYFCKSDQLEKHCPGLLLSLARSGCDIVYIIDKVCRVAVVGKGFTKSCVYESRIKEALYDEGIGVYGSCLDSHVGNLFLYMDQTMLDRAVRKIYNVIKDC